MKVNFNKEMLLKNRFWILLGVAAFLSLVGMFYLEFSVDAESERKKLKEFISKTKDFGPSYPYQSAPTIQARETIAKTAQGAESTVWKNSYDAQEDLFKWPKAIEEEFNFATGLFANQITIGPLSAKNMWPQDIDGLMHGEIQQLSNTFFTIKNRDDKIKKFQLTVSGANVNVQGQPNTALIHEARAKNPDKKLWAVTYQKGKYFNDPLTEQERNLFADSYRTQVDDILQIVHPLDEKDNGVVQLRGWRFKPNDWNNDKKTNFIRYVKEEWKKELNFSSEAWIAQENLWIQQEIYQVIRSANDHISEFTPVKKGKLAKGEVWGEGKDKPYTFKNSYFELELRLDKDKGLWFKIKNLQSKPQKLDGLKFRVRMLTNKGYEPEVFTFSDEPLEPMGEGKGKDTFVALKAEPKKETERKGIYSVEQVLSWETAAVKRIDYISIASNAGDELSHSQRTYPDGLKPLEPDDGQNPGGPGAPPIKGGFRPPGKGAAVGVGSNKVLLHHGLWTERYAEAVSEQSRRIPVCVVLIVDQAHVDRVLTAFNNSRLRFLTTQVSLNQYTDSMQPPPLPKSDVVSPFPPVFPPPGNPVPAQGAGSVGQETNVELVLYGIMTLYQRYPPRAPLAVKKQ